jgi:hypothetical protein
MSATKKQVNDVENAVVVLEERIEKMEEEHVLLKQMITMQSTLIENLQMMMKMMSVSQSSYKVMHIGGNAINKNENKGEGDDSECNETQVNTDTKQKQDLNQQNSINTLKHRMSRVV